MKTLARRLANQSLERPVAAVFVVAIVVRLCLAACVALLSDGSLFPDDRGYITLAARHAANSVIWDAGSQALWNVNSSFLAPVGLLFKVFGPVPLLAQSMSALAGSATAACVAALVGRHTRPGIALGAGLTAAMYPSQVLWSSLVLKDALVWISLALLAVVTAWWQQSDSHRRFLIGLGYLTAALLYLSNLRPHTLLVACVALTVATIWSSRSLRAARVIATLLLLLVVPAVAGLGVAGNRLLQTGFSGLGEQRQAGAVFARTALVDVPSHTQLDRATDRLAQATLETAQAEPATTATLETAQAEPATTATLETAQAEYEFWLETTASAVPSTIIDDLLYLPTGLRVMLLDPLPHQLVRSNNLAFAFAEHLVWYPVLLLAIIGLSTVRQRSPELVFTALTGIGLTTMWALVEGNFGTAFRHRGEVIWAVLVFAGIGAELLMNRRSLTRNSRGTAPPTGESGDRLRID